jgi:pimeloyl-ACP methyl ester carboxylesterase
MMPKNSLTKLSFQRIPIEKLYWLLASLALLSSLIWPQIASASGPAQQEGRRVGLVSTKVECLAVNAGIQNNVSSTVKLVWTGQIEEAYLVLSAAGSEAGHSFYINGQLVGQTPVQPDGQPCDPNFEREISIPADLLVNGENIITLTNDANPGDSWTAASMRLEIHGVLSGPPVAALEAPTDGDVGTLATCSPGPGDELVPSSYEGGSISQRVYYHIPDGYDSVPSVPLVVVLHGFGQDGDGMRNLLDSEADERDWIVVSPDMHGHYYPTIGSYALAWPGAQHDIIDTIEWMIDTCPKVDKSRIYITGGSMGGQATAMTAAKYPDIFAAAVPWKPITDLTDWYNERAILEPPDGPNEGNKHIRRETGAASGAGSAGTTPLQAPFEYERRSSIKVPQNNRLMPIKMWHGTDDLLVPIHHAQDLKNTINSNWDPPNDVILIEVNNSCPGDTYHHCYNPDLNELFDFLQSFTRSSTAPNYLAIRTDESKSYYWLDIDQSGSDHWTQITATYIPASKTINAVVTDTNQLTLGFNLGPTPITGVAGIAQAGLGLSETAFWVQEQNQTPYTQTYTAGQYFTVALQNTGSYTLTISPYVAPAPEPDTTSTYLPVLIKQ